MSRNKCDYRKPWFSFRSPRFEILSRLLGVYEPSAHYPLNTDDEDLAKEYDVLGNIANHLLRRIHYIEKVSIFEKKQSKLL